MEAEIVGGLRRISIRRGGPGSGHHGHRGRPGKVGGSLPSGQGYRVIEKEGLTKVDLQSMARSERAEGGFRHAVWDEETGEARIYTDMDAVLDYYAEQDRKLDYEVHRFILGDGKSQFVKGTKYHVKLNEQDLLGMIELMKQAEEKNLRYVDVHNHPRNVTAISDLDIPPSYDDYDLAMNMGFKEWHVVTPNGKFVMTRNPEKRYFGWGDRYAVEENWDNWTVDNVRNYFPGYRPGRAGKGYLLRISEDPNAAMAFQKFQRERGEIIIEDAGYFDIEWVPNE
jgi:hypothetical protein